MNLKHLQKNNNRKKYHIPRKMGGWTKKLKKFFSS